MHIPWMWLFESHSSPMSCSTWHKASNLESPNPHMTLYNQTREVMLVHLVIFNTCIANQWQGYEVITEVKRRGGKKNWNWRWWVMEVNAPSDTKLSPEQRWGRLLFSHMEDISHRTHSHGQREMLWLIACCKRPSRTVKRKKINHSCINPVDDFNILCTYWSYKQTRGTLHLRERERP